MAQHTKSSPAPPHHRLLRRRLTRLRRFAAAIGSPPAAVARPLGTTGKFFKKRDEWRKHPVLTDQFRQALPGFGIAVVAFGIYLVGEAAYDKFYRPDHHPKPSASGSH